MALHLSSLIDASDKVWNSLSSTDPLWSASRVLYLSSAKKGLQRFKRPNKLLTTNWYVAVVSWSLCINHEAQESALNKQTHIQRSYRHLIRLKQFFSAIINRLLHPIEIRTISLYLLLGTIGPHRSLYLTFPLNGRQEFSLGWRPCSPRRIVECHDLLCRATEFLCSGG